MTKRLTLAALFTILAAPTGAAAQDPGVASLKGLFDITKGFITATANMLDEELYAFQPTEDVRSMGQILAHIADAQYLFCSAAAGEADPHAQSFEQTATTKAQVVDALAQGFAYCDGVFGRTTDRMGTNAVTFFGGPNTVFGVLAFNSAHNYEHYGNLVTYMRLNGIVPPSSSQ